MLKNAEESVYFGFSFLFLISIIYFKKFISSDRETTGFTTSWIV